MLLASSSVIADGVVVDKVYHPYVTANEQSVEWRFLSSETDTNNRLGQRIGYGFSMSPNLILETYIIAERDRSDDFLVQAIETELRWMITEQGQYWADWGALFEVEAAERDGGRNYEITSGVIFEKEINRSSVTMNFFVVQEWGETIKTEMETEFRFQYRYRYRSEIQPAIELYTGENYVGIGPAMIGLKRFSGQKQLKWEAGFITEVAHEQKDISIRLALEFEF
jgi:predicted subunit of tRNA(5-methylaminomethyl-2-thiouridylate) methyltransferase